MGRFPTQIRTKPRHNAYLVESLKNHFSSVRDQLREVLDDGIDGQNRITTYISVAVLEVSSHGFNQRLKQLLVVELAQEAQCASSNVFIGIVQIPEQCVTVH